MADTHATWSEADLIGHRTDVVVSAALLLGREAEGAVIAICDQDPAIGEDEIHHRLALVGLGGLTQSAQPLEQFSNSFVDGVGEYVRGAIDVEAGIF